MEIWVPSPEEIAYYKLLSGGSNISDEDYKVLLPFSLDSLNEQLCQKFTKDNLPASLKLYLSKTINFLGCDQTLTSRSMGTVSYSWDRSSLPSSIANLTRGYDRCSYGKFHVFRPLC